MEKNNILKLISLFEKRPSLWDPSDTNYTNRFKRTQDLTDISNKMQIDG